MIIDKYTNALRLFARIGEIDDCYLEEATTADIVAYNASRKRVKQRAITAASVGAASIGIAVTLLLLKSRRRQTV